MIGGRFLASRSSARIVWLLGIISAFLFFFPVILWGDTAEDSLRNVDPLVAQLKSLRNTDPSFERAREWKELERRFRGEIKEAKGKRLADRAKLFFHAALLFEEIAHRSGDMERYREAYTLYLKVGEDHSAGKYGDDALYRAILLQKKFLREPEEMQAKRSLFFQRYPESEYVVLLQGREGSRPQRDQDEGAPIEDQHLPLIVIDPGHGGDDEGAVGPAGLREKDLSLSIAKLLVEKFRAEKRARVVLTRTGDTFVPLFERTQIANRASADLFLSIHMNAIAERSESTQGFEIYYVSQEASPDAIRLANMENRQLQIDVGALGAFLEELYRRGAKEVSRPVAEAVFHEMDKVLPKQFQGVKLRRRGVKQGPFFVLFGAEMPAILLELFFLSHPDDSYLLSLPQFRKTVADAIFRGVSQALVRRTEEEEGPS
ncbi:N-acetylmuramoyl-L-alanine amidase [bacterium]|nr:N-acetylmuramoyl-L-alanine amidase [bacterium]